MKRTEYITMTKAGYMNAEYRRVYQDEDKNLYIRKGKEYYCINNTPCAEMLVRCVRAITDTDQKGDTR